MKWITFNDIIAGDRSKRAISNYYRNKQIGIKAHNDDAAADVDIIEQHSKEALLHSTAIEIKGKQLLYCQYGGNFPLMRFSHSDFGDVCCEIMAVYNAMKMCGYIGSDDSFEEFFRISCEFEVNAPYIVSSGHFGGDYKKIDDFLVSRNVRFTVCKDIDKIDELIKNSASCIISYRFDLVKVHTFCCFYDNGKIVSINRGSGCLYLWRNDSVKECLRGGKLLVGYALNP